MAEAYARGRAKDEEARAGLTPLAPGERPRWVTVAAVVALVLAVANVGAAAFVEDKPRVAEWRQAALQAVILLVAAAGMWRAKYWAVLGFEVLLAFAAVYGAASLLLASNVQAAVLSLAVMGGAGFLFYKLVREMARIQMPTRPGR
jgi:hypothetical protein